MNNSAYSFRVVWSDEDDAFVAVCPEFPGVSAVGDSAEQALAEAKVALELMIETLEEEGVALPEPATLSDYSGQFRLRVPRTLHALLAERAADEGVSLNTYAVSILSAGVGSDRSLKQVQRCIGFMLGELRSDLYGTLLRSRHQTNTTASSVMFLPEPFLPAYGTAEAGGESWQN